MMREQIIRIKVFLSVTAEGLGAGVGGPLGRAGPAEPLVAFRVGPHSCSCLFALPLAPVASIINRPPFYLILP